MDRAATASPSPTSWSARAAAPGGSRSTTAGTRRARPRREPRRDRSDPLLGLAAAALRRDQPLRRDEARPHRGRGPHLPGHPPGPLDRPRRGDRRPRARARGAPARPAGRERRQLGQQGDPNGASADAGDPAESKRPAGRPDELRAALRALGAPELARPRARLLGRPRALAGQPGRVPAAHGLQHRQLLRRRGAGHRRSGARSCSPRRAARSRRSSRRSWSTRCAMRSSSTAGRAR